MEIKNIKSFYKIAQWLKRKLINSKLNITQINYNQLNEERDNLTILTKNNFNAYYVGGLYLREIVSMNTLHSCAGDGLYYINV